jgi:hypothetical protein
MGGFVRFAPRRWRALAVAAVMVLCVGVPAAYAALGVGDTANGTGALGSENGGEDNTADGYNALASNTAGNENTAVGDSALHENLTGIFNTAVGVDAGYFNTANQNTAVGYQAMAHNTVSDNTGVGAHALYNDSVGTGEVAVGSGALQATHGNDNTGIGESALLWNGAGTYMSALGYQAGDDLSSDGNGSNDTFLGANASQGAAAEVFDATAVGANATVTQNDSLVLGGPNVSTGIHTSAPQSDLQIGAGASSSWGDYLQLPVVTATDKTPPAADCNNSTLVGRMVLQQVRRKMTLWACSTAGVWVKA